MRERWRRLTPVQQGFVWSLVLLALWIGYWVVFDPGAEHAQPGYFDAQQAQLAESDFERFRPIIIIAGGIFLVFIFMAVWSFVHLMRDRGVRFDDLDAEEQERRERAGDLLKGLGSPGRSPRADDD